MTDLSVAEAIANRSVEIAHLYNHEMVTLDHLLYALLEDADVQKCFTALNVNHLQAKKMMESFFDSNSIAIGIGGQPTKSKNFGDLFTRVVSTAVFTSHGPLTTLDILLVLASFPYEDNYAVTTLLRVGVTPLAIKRYLSHGRVPETHDGGSVPQNNVDDPRAFILKYCADLNRQAKDNNIDPVIGRASEITDITQIIARRTKNNAILVGEPGVGKTAIAEGLALNIVNDAVPDVIKGWTVYSLDVGSLVAGTRFRGDFEERMKQLLDCLVKVGNSILFIDEIHTIMDAGSGSKGSLDVANMLKPALAKGTLRCIGSTTIDEYRKHFEKDRALVRRFKKLMVDEPSPEISKLILMGIKSKYEDFHKITFTDSAISAAVDLSYRYMNGKLPDKAIDLIDSAGARQRISHEQLSIVGVEQIEAEVSLITKIPSGQISENETEKLETLEDDLKAVIFGQDDAITALVDATFISRAGLREDNKPEGCYLFAGPSGTGKTEMARQLAVSRNSKLIRFDMSEYMEKHSVSKLIGAPPGYIGYSEGGAGNGLLTNEIETNPNCVLLLDEIEKAHSDIYNIFLQVMDEGHLTNSKGSRVSFRNVVVIMTTNAGSSEIKTPLGFNAVTNEVNEKAIKDTFAPEFRNRLDAIVQFGRLKPENMVKIVDKFLAELSVLTSARNVLVSVDISAREWLAEHGYDPDMGARPLKRVIHENIKKPLSRLMLGGSLKNGGIVTVSVVDNKITLTA